jgi:hypothetical protein
MAPAAPQRDGRPWGIADPEHAAEFVAEAKRLEEPAESWAAVWVDRRSMQRCGWMRAVGQVAEAVDVLVDELLAPMLCA